MTTIGTLFSGGEGVGVGARNAGLSHLWGVEHDDKIASVARLNGFNTITGDVRDADLMRSLPRPDVLHASPVCKNASNAKADGEESPEDIATADATCAYIDHFKPDIFTLENVYGYRTFTAFAHILECLNRNRYSVDYWHLNAADYGVPQTRQRLILVARLNGKPRKPLATHARPDKLTPIFDDRLPWVGWYKAIEDLIDTLPASQFAKWQLERLQEGLTETVLLNRNTTERDDYFKNSIEPAYVVTSDGDSGRRRAFILNGTSNDYGASVTACASDEPIYTMTGSMDRRPARAFITDARNTRNDGGNMTVIDDTDPCFTLTASNNDGRYRAFIMPNANTSSGVMREADEPAPTQGNADRVGNQPRAWLSSGRVVKMTPRALARFQSFPDSYILPDKAKLACTVIGNAVPPLLYHRVIEAQA